MAQNISGEKIGLLEDIVKEYKIADEFLKLAEVQKEEARNRIEVLLKNLGVEEVILKNQKIISKVIVSETLDTKRLKKDCPIIYGKFLKEGERRYFRIINNGDSYGN